MDKRNVVRGAIYGAVVQAQTIRGGVHVHASEPIVPRQLPFGGADIVGREAEIEALDDAVQSACRVMVISGMAGVGKTALCLRWVRSIADQFPDGQLYVDLRGFDPSCSPLATAEAVRGFLDGFGVSPERIRPDVTAQVNLYRSIVAHRRVLVVLDNARDVEQIRELLPAGRDCVVVITSRAELTGLLVNGGVHRTGLGLLSGTAARTLVAARIAGVLPDDDAVGELASMCAGLPLALAIIAAQAAQQRFSLHDLVFRLRTERRLLDALDTGDLRTTARSVFSWSYESLSSSARRLFRYLGLMTGADLALHVVASLAAMSAARVRTVLAELLRANLVEEHLPGRFRLHDLLREYSADLLAGDPEHDRADAIARMIDSYLHSALSADAKLNPHRLRIAVPPPVPGVEFVESADYERAREWFAAEQQLAVDAVHLAVQVGFDRLAWQLTWALVTYLRRFGHMSARESTQRQALAAVRRLSDSYAEGKIYYLLARTLLRQGKKDDAETALQEAAERFQQLGEPAAEAEVLIIRTTLRWLQGRTEEADADARRALSLAESAGIPNLRATTLNTMGRSALDLGVPQETINCCNAALDLYLAVGNPEGVAFASRLLGSAHRRLGRLTEAMAHYQLSLDIDLTLGDDFYAAVVLDQQGLVYSDLGRTAAARVAWERSLALFEYLEHPLADDVRARLG